MPRFRRAAIATVLLATTALASARAHPLQDPLARTVPVSIDREPLDAALGRLATQAGLPLAIHGASLTGRTAPPLSGRMTVASALDRLLRHSGLVYRVEHGTILVESAATAQNEENLEVWGHRAADDAYGLAFGKPKVLTTSSTRAQLEQLQIDNLSEYGRRVDAAVDYNPNSDSINIRGLDQNRVLTTVDGIPIPWLYDGARGVQGGVSGFDFDGLSKFDVVKDTDSSVFGAGALAGVVSAKTLDPSDVLTGDRKAGGLTKYIYNSADHSSYVSQALATRVNWTSVLLQGSYRTGGQLRNSADTGGSGTSRTKTNPADYVQRDLLAKIDQKLAGGQHVGLLGEYFIRDHDEDTLTSVGSTYSTYATRTISRRKRVAVSYDLDSPDKDGWIDKAHAVAYVQQVGLEIATATTRRTAPVGAYDRDSTLREKSFGGIFSASKLLHTRIGTHEVALGGDIRGTRTTQYAAGVDNCSSRITACTFLHVNQSDMPDVDGIDAGFFLQDRISFLNGHLRVTPGLRFDYYDRSPKETASYTINAAYMGLPAASSDSKFSPKVLVEYDIVPNVTLFAQWSQAFRAPSATELYLTYGGSGSYVAIGNPDLKPETSNGILGGVNFGDDHLGARITAYDTYYRNFIDQLTTTAAAAGISGNYPFGVFEYINRSHVRIYGSELSAHWRFLPHWHSWLSANYAHGRDTDAHTYLNTIPPLKAIVGLGYAQTHFGADASLTATIRRSNVANDASDLNKAPGYAIVDLTGWWQPSFLPGLKLQAGLFNVFDQRYYNALGIPDSATVGKAYYAQPGRTFKLAATLRF